MLHRLMRTGLRRGLLDGSRPWLVVGVAAAGFRLVARMARRDEVVVLRERLPEGATLVISNGVPAPEVRGSAK